MKENHEKFRFQPQEPLSYVTTKSLKSLLDVWFSDFIKVWWKVVCFCSYQTLILVTRWRIDESLIFIKIIHLSPGYNWSIRRVSFLGQKVFEIVFSIKKETLVFKKLTFWFQVPLEYGNGSPAESLLAHLSEGCLTDRWQFDDKEGKLKNKSTKLSHLKRICEWLVKVSHVQIFKVGNIYGSWMTLLFIYLILCFSWGAVFRMESRLLIFLWWCVAPYWSTTKKFVLLLLKLYDIA